MNVFFILLLFIHSHLLLLLSHHQFPLNRSSACDPSWTTSLNYYWLLLAMAFVEQNHRICCTSFPQRNCIHRKVVTIQSLWRHVTLEGNRNAYTKQKLFHQALQTNFQVAESSPLCEYAISTIRQPYDICPSLGFCPVPRMVTGNNCCGNYHKK